VTTLVSGKRIPADTVMYSAGRQGATADLDLPAAGLEADHRGRIPVDEHYRTTAGHIYAVGDVIGFPALAATSMEQGRLAAYHAIGEPSNSLLELQPIGIYTIPEISYVGQTEDQLTASAVPYEVGIARYRELARGQIVGDSYGCSSCSSPPTPAAARRARLRHPRHRAGPPRPGDHDLRRHRRPARRHRLQLPHAVRGVQGRRPRRGEQDARCPVLL
jgi:hypothetical protein